MAKTQTRPWDPAEHLETEEDMAAYLNVALEEGDLSLIMATLGDIARAQRMAVVAQETGLGRESLYRSLSAEGTPEFSTVLKVVRALGPPASGRHRAWSERRFMSVSRALHARELSSRKYMNPNPPPN